MIHLTTVQKKIPLLITGSYPSADGVWGNCEGAINTEAPVWCRLSQQTVMSFTWRSDPHQQWNAKPSRCPTRDHTYSSCRFFIWEKALAWTDMMALSLKSLRRGEREGKNERGGAMARATAACFRCQHQPYSVKATKTSIEVREWGRREKKIKRSGLQNNKTLGSSLLR